MRHVFPTAEIPHKWAHQTQDSARNPQGNLYFHGDTLYSYRDSYPIAKIFRKKGAVLALHVENTYSMTTAGHCSDARRATSHLPSIIVPRVDIGEYAVHAKDCHAANLEYLIKEAAEYLAKAQRALQVSNVTWRRVAAEERLKDAQDYCAFFGIRRKVPAFPELAWAAALQRAERIENPDPASADKRERERAKRKAAEGEITEYREAMADSMKAAGHWIGYRGIKHWHKTLERALGQKGTPWYHNAARRTDWRLRDAFGAGHVAPYYGHNGERDAIMLRINGDQIETSAGARIPLAAAPMVWERVQRALGKGYKPAGLGVKIGDYPLTEIRPDGTLVAGCHEIPHNELRSMARALGLAAV